MITFKQYLSEDGESNEVKDLIESHCGPFLEQSHGAGFLYRGVKDFNRLDYDVVKLYDGTKTTYATKTVRQDRIPLNTRRQVHKWIDEWFEKNLGFKARTSTMFAFGEIKRRTYLAQYGTPCVVFPIGPIRFAWSPKVRDLFISLPDEQWTSQGHEGEELKKMIWEWLDDHDYQTTDLAAAIRSEHEIMIQCDKYYAFEMENRMDLQISLDIFPN
jgi:hypothetical protein